MPGILENYLKVEELVRKAEQRAGRASGEVRIVAVSKTHPVELMRELLEQLNSSGNAPVFGENYVQEFKHKQEALGSTVDCHLIGPLQSNKSKDAVRLFSVIETLHSAHLAEVLDKEARKINKVQEVLLQINISADPQKSGFAADEALRFISGELPQMRNLYFKGLMAITKLYPEPELARPDFKALRDLSLRARDLLGAKTPRPFELSMGMSADFEVAIEEGATLVRVGTAIFGERHAAGG